MNDEEGRQSLIPINWECRTPKWWKDILQYPNKYFLVLTDDADSYYSCDLLNQLSNGKLNVGGFYDFHKGWFISDNVITDYSLGIVEPIFVDCSAIHFKTFNNHYMMEKNANEINFNNFCGFPLHYCQKFAGSTYAIIMWLYGVDISTLPENELCRLLLLDSYYLGHFSDMFKTIHTAWLKDLGWDEILLPILDKYSQKAFKKCHDEHYNYKIKIDDNGKLFTNDENTILPDTVFEKILTVEERTYKLNEYKSLPEDERKKAFNLSRTRIDTVKGSFII